MKLIKFSQLGYVSNFHFSKTREYLLRLRLLAGNFSPHQLSTQLLFFRFTLSKEKKERKIIFRGDSHRWWQRNLSFAYEHHRFHLLIPLVVKWYICTEDETDDAKWRAESLRHFRVKISRNTRIKEDLRKCEPFASHRRVCLSVLCSNGTGLRRKWKAYYATF